MISIADEGRLPVVALATLALVLALALGWEWSMPVWFATLGCVHLFRMLPLSLTDLPLAVVSPVRGQVTGIHWGDDPWLNRPALRISITMPFPGVGPLYSPADGKVDQYWTDLDEIAALDVAPNAFDDDDAENWLESPTRYTLGLCVEGDVGIIYSVSSARAHSRLKFDQAPGERAARGRRSGFVYFASQVDVLLPAEARAAVVLGQKVDGGATIIAHRARD